jgi:O-antigen ligase
MNGMLYVYKCMQGKSELTDRFMKRHGTILFILVAIMLVSLFFSRVVLSTSIIAFSIIAFIHPEPRSHFNKFFSTPLLWGMTLLFLVPLTSGLWTDHQYEWRLMMQIKVPLFFLPLAFASPFNFSEKQWKWLACLFILLLIGASVFCMVNYAWNAEEINSAYLRAKTMLTPLDNDHVRFSWLISIGILLSAWIAVKNRKTNRTIFKVFLIAVLWLTLFLHILAVRTGLIGFYLMLIGLLTWMSFSKRWNGYSWLLIGLLCSLLPTAYHLFPTLKNKIDYFNYDISHAQKMNYTSGSNDAVRIISINAGWNVMKQQPVSGVGFGDVINNTKEWYAEHYPQMIEADKIYPSGEWIMYGAGAGWIGLLVFLFVMAVPFFMKVRNRLIWILLNVSIFISLLFDPGLEVQFGVFAYSFTVLVIWKFSTQNFPQIMQK